jgi:hypothetical protein
MTQYIQFATEDGSSILVEVEEEEVSPPPGLVKAGLQDKLKQTVGTAQSTFSETINTTIKHNVNAFIESVQCLSEPPTEMEVTFGLKMTGEVGNVAVCKGSGEVNYGVKLVWKQLSKPK